MKGEVKCRILVVDDNEDIRILMKKRLETAGYEVLTAENGLMATETIQKESPSVVILDLMMPVMDGWQFLEWKKQQTQQVADVPVLVVSAISTHTKEPDGVHAFLRKPVSLNNILDHIDHLTAI